MKRRQFIRAASLTTVPILLDGSSLFAHPANYFSPDIDPGGDRVIVLIQLLGGNDSLQMVIPIDQYSGLSKARPALLIPESQILGLNKETALHPAMTGLRSLFDSGRLAVLQGVGYPNHNRSHFRSTDIYTSASAANQTVNTGWLGRYLDQLHPQYPVSYPSVENPDPFAITIGSSISETCQGVSSNFSLAVRDPLSLSPISEAEQGVAPDTNYGKELSYLRTAIYQTNKYGDTIKKAANKGKNSATYKTDGLSGQLKTVAKLISGGLRTKIYITAIGGFDTHANQVVVGNPALGAHATLLGQLSDAIFSFQEDMRLQSLESRVMGFTFSEFGRRIYANSSNGTDHGDSAHMFVFGSCTNGGVYGKSHTIKDPIDKNEGLPMQIDFRNVYGSFLQSWFKLENQDVKNLIFAGYQNMPLISSCAITTPNKDLSVSELDIQAMPNPFGESTMLRFSLNSLSLVQMDLFDTMGKKLRSICNQNYLPGVHDIRLNGQDLPAGHLFLRIVKNGRIHNYHLAHK